ncbi:cysteine dioxygenase [Alcaligenaceae bacterium]|nr:cysteine dioxygenase [Alcaligenaceae bacterium]
MTNLVNSAGKDEARILDEGGALLASLVASDDWLPEAYAKPHPEYYQQYLLHCAPDNSFSVVSFVWGPGQKTPVHDHTVWGLIGMLRGSETEESFEFGDGNTPMRSTGVQRLDPGMVGKVSPTVGDVHRVVNAYDDQVSISIHVYGANIGKVSRHVYDEATGQSKSFISGYAN